MRICILALKIKIKNCINTYIALKGKPTFFMSYGELLLIGLLNFIHEIINHKSRRKIWYLLNNLEIHIFRLELLILF
jgi:hypothetical protein